MFKSASLNVVVYLCTVFILNFQVDSGGDGSEKLILFFKTKPDVITPENLHSNVFVSSMLDSPVTSLYHAVQKVKLKPEFQLLCRRG